MGTEGRDTLVAIQAHPDDDMLFSPLLVHYAKKGIDVHVVFVTYGEKGVEFTDISPGAELAAVRKAEEIAAFKHYGIHPPRFLDYLDQEVPDLSEEEVNEMQSQLREILEEVSPRVVITFGPEGFTGNIDHVAVSPIVTDLIARWHAEEDSSGAPERLFYTMFPESQAVVNGLGLFREVPNEMATTIVDATDGLEEAKAGADEYVSQFPQDWLEAYREFLIGTMAPEIHLRWVLNKNGAPQEGGSDIFA